MYRDLLEPYWPGTSAVHRLPAGVKVVAVAVYVSGVVLLPRGAWTAHAATGVALAAVMAIARVAPLHLLRRLLLVEPFALGVALLALLQPDGLTACVAMLIKSTLSLAAMVLLSATTRFSAIVQVLWRWRVPALLVSTLALMHRYLFVLADELRRMQRARRCRTFTAGRWLTWHTAATVLSQLFVRSSERAERIFFAMCARGWKT